MLSIIIFFVYILNSKERDICTDTKTATHINLTSANVLLIKIIYNIKVNYPFPVCFCRCLCMKTQTKTHESYFLITFSFIHLVIIITLLTQFFHMSEHWKQQLFNFFPVVSPWNVKNKHLKKTKKKFSSGSYYYGVLYIGEINNVYNENGEKVKWRKSEWGKLIWIDMNCLHVQNLCRVASTIQKKWKIVKKREKSGRCLKRLMSFR